MVPLTLGMLTSGPASGYLSDRHGPRLFASGSMILTGVCFGAMELLPVNFTYWVFGLLLFCVGVAIAAFG
jgi:sugar phosphate permease